MQGDCCLNFTDEERTTGIKNENNQRYPVIQDSELQEDLASLYNLNI